MLIVDWVGRAVDCLTSVASDVGAAALVLGRAVTV